MTRNTKILIGVGAVALAYYFYTKKKSNDKNFSNFESPTLKTCGGRFCSPKQPYCRKSNNGLVCSSIPPITTTALESSLENA
jgi:hypothetical protein